MTVERNNQPVIILGAARSGTKLLRSLISATGRYAEVPFDVNYIWRYGNERSPHDALPFESLSECARTFIQYQLQRSARSPGNLPFVEKTVSNILRVPFVKAVYPHAKYVALIRDGRDVSESAARCWREPPQTGYLLQKARSFPWRYCAPYAWKYASDVVRRLGLDKHLRTWGPRYPGIDDDVNQLSLIEVCARQWVASLEHYERSRPVLSRDQLLELRYEELVSDSQNQVRRLCDFLEIDKRRPALEFADRTTHSHRIASRRNLAASDMQRVLAITAATLDKWGYGKRPARTLQLVA